jgi:hypothetical protein
MVLLAMSKKSKNKRIPMRHQKKSSYTYRYAQCQCKEDIPRDVVDFFHAMDPGDPDVPPRFRCENCGGVMLPIQSRA